MERVCRAALERSDLPRQNIGYLLQAVVQVDRVIRVARRDDTDDHTGQNGRRAGDRPNDNAVRRHDIVGSRGGHPGTPRVTLWLDYALRSNEPANDDAEETPPPSPLSIAMERG